MEWENIFPWKKQKFQIDIINIELPLFIFHTYLQLELYLSIQLLISQKVSFKLFFFTFLKFSMHDVISHIHITKMMLPLFKDKRIFGVVNLIHFVNHVLEFICLYSLIKIPLIFNKGNT